MNKHEIEEILKSVIIDNVPSEEALTRISDETDFEIACDIAHEHISPAYDSGNQDLGDYWAKLLKDIKIHAINHLDDGDTMKFITNSLD